MLVVYSLRDDNVSLYGPDWNIAKRTPTDMQGPAFEQFIITQIMLYDILKLNTIMLLTNFKEEIGFIADEGSDSTCASCHLFLAHQGNLVSHV